MKRWVLGCLCCLFFPPAVSAKCSLRSFSYTHCFWQDTPTSAFVPWQEPDDFFPTDPPDHLRWSVERPKPQKRQPLALHLGKGPKLSYRKHEVTLTQNCWHLTFRAFSKIGLYCRSTF